MNDTERLNQITQDLTGFPKLITDICSSQIVLALAVVASTLYNIVTICWLKWTLLGLSCAPAVILLLNKGRLFYRFYQQNLCGLTFMDKLMEIKRCWSFL